MVEKLLLCALAVVSLVGWSALATLIARLSPETLLARLNFFALLFLSVLFTSAALAYYLSLKSSLAKRREGRLRASMLLGIPPAVAVAAAVWLQSLRALSLASGLILLGTALVVELIVALRGRRNIDIRGVQKVSN